MDNIQTARTTVILKENNVTNVSGSDYPHMYPGEDLSFSIEKFKKSFKVVTLMMELKLAQNVRMNNLNKMESASQSWL